ncbi:hypothetical protein PLICRDRAFT_455464 [Plicaturopsis crispa FD-325 SS-3]|uniref:F-box domain-containing protein n=1 Tax=Plicaturopsis crispa FD-325 SS-3 TaxID=944288 RepID=A0A0C9SVU8_PLICR|nr:hypothetical protein PLICRDRAFT_455464 [Plicaturopsis crispa FD-325 SS-3]
MFPFQSLPTELALHTLGFAVASSRETCLALTLVASWMRDLTLPHLLATVVIRNPFQFPKFRDWLVAHPQYALHVKNLYIVPVLNITGTLEKDMLLDIMGLCTEIGNIVVSVTHLHLLLWPINAKSLSDPATSGSSAARRLQITMIERYRGEWGDDSGGPFVGLTVNFHHHRVPPVTAPNGSNTLSVLTRLDIDNSAFRSLYKGFQTATHAAILRLFSNVTRVRWGIPPDFRPDEFPDFFDDVKAYLSEHPLLELLVLVVAPDNELPTATVQWFIAAREADRRLCISSADVNAVAVWERTIEDGGDIWAEAVRETEAWVLSQEVKQLTM